MIKWFVEIAFALAIKKQLSTSFVRALRFVRCDYSMQQKIDDLLGVKHSNLGSTPDDNEDHQN